MDEIKTFDLIGFKSDGFISSMIQHCQSKALDKKYRNVQPNITHVGLAVRGDDLMNVPDDILSIFKDQINASKVYIFESHFVPKCMDSVPDVFGAHVRGVRLRPLDEIVEQFPGEVYYSSHIFAVDNQCLHRLVAYMVEKNHIPYEVNMTVLLGNVITCFRSKNHSSSTIFCSELVARVLMEIDVLSKGINPEHAVPLDFYINTINYEGTLDVDNEIPILFGLPIRIFKSQSSD